MDCPLLEKKALAAKKSNFQSNNKLLEGIRLLQKEAKKVLFCGKT